MPSPRPRSSSTARFDEDLMMRVNTVATSPFEDQRPGTSGLRKKVQVFQAAALSRELRPVGVRRARGLRGRDPGGRRRRPLLQPDRGADHPQDGRGERLRADRGRPGRAAVHPGRVLPDPQAPGVRRGDPLGQPQPRRPARRFRHQVQRRQRRAGAREDHRGDLSPHPSRSGSTGSWRRRISTCLVWARRGSATPRSRSSIRSPTTRS